MSLDKMLEEVRELVQAEVGQQVNEGKHKLNAKHKAAAHTIDRLQAKLKGVRQEFDAMRKRARDAEARNKALEDQVSALKSLLPKDKPIDKEKAKAAGIDPMTLLTAAMLSTAKK